MSTYSKLSIFCNFLKCNFPGLTMSTFLFEKKIVLGCHLQALALSAIQAASWRGVYYKTFYSVIK
jgi:hypothetical protein